MSFCCGSPDGFVGFAVFLEVRQEVLVFFKTLVAQLEIALLQFGIESFEQFAFGRCDTVRNRQRSEESIWNWGHHDVVNLMWERTRIALLIHQRRATDAAGDETERPILASFHCRK